MGLVDQGAQVKSGHAAAASLATASSGDPLAIGARRSWPAAVLAHWAVQLLAVAFQFGLLILIIRMFAVEHRAFLHVMVLAFAGFLIHHLLPLRFRMAFFALLSVGATAMVMGAMNTAWLLVVGTALLAIAHVPVAFRFRIAAMAVVTAALVWMRNNPALADYNAIWPIFGAMFMFRMVVYLYDLKNKAAPFTPDRAAAYFFMIPNVCFPLFPIVDYKTFCRTFYNDQPIGIYQKGVDWMLRGLIHLLAYRLVTQQFILTPDAVHDLGDVAQAMLATFLLYLKVSGTFHLIIGFLHLFGFNLSETHHLYMLSSSFTDFWRRINIYWKDFIQKVVFYPVFFRLKRLGDLWAIVLATSVAFLATWLLHSAPVYWNQGRFPIRWQDMAFWSLLGGGVVLNIILESRKKRTRSLKKPKRTVRGELTKAMKTIAFFVFIVVAWSMWSADSWEQWTTMLSKARNFTAGQLAAVIGGLAALGAAAIVFGHTVSERMDGAGGKTHAAMTPAQFWRSSAAVTSVSVVILAVGSNPLWFDDVPAVASAINRLRQQRQTAEEAERVERGYYEDVTDVSSFNVDLWSLYMGQPANWEKSLAARPTGAFPPWELTPNTAHPFKGAMRTINPWGMRDRADYTLERPSGVFRMVIVGESHTAGAGVGDAETYENLLEDRLNADRAKATGRRYEILNYGVGGYGPYGRYLTLERYGFRFKPDAVLYVSVNDDTWMVRDLVDIRTKGIAIPDEYLIRLAAEAGVDAQTPRLIAEQKLKPHAEPMLKWLYGRIVERCRAEGATPYAVFLPKPENETGWRQGVNRTIQWAREAGFTVIDILDTYDRVADLESLWIRPWDKHPNPRGHRMLADNLYEKLTPHLPDASASPTEP